MTGASGVLGRRVAWIAQERGHDVRRASRSPRDTEGWVPLDLVSGDGLIPAVRGCDAVIHCATDPSAHRQVDQQGTANLIGTAAAAGSVHIVYPGIVGSDVIPYSYYRSKTAAEELLVSSAAVPHTIQRYTQFHQLIWAMTLRLARLPLVPVPRDTRFQVLDPSAAAARLVDAAEADPAGRLEDLGGPTAYEAVDLVRSVLSASGLRRRPIRVPLPGLVGASFRAGGNLTPNRDADGRTWNEFVEERIQASERSA